MFRFTSPSNITQININSYVPYANEQPIVAAYGYLPYCATPSFLNSNENWIIVDIKGLLTFPNQASTKALIAKYDDFTGAVPMNGFYNNRNIREIDTSKWNINASTSFAGAFRSCPNLRKIKFGTHNTSLVTSIQNMFSGDISLNHLDLSGLNLSAVTTTTGAFDNLANLTDIDGWTPIYVSYSLYSANGGQWLTHDSLMKVINSLPTVQTSQTLTLGSVNLGRLSSEEIAIATAKGWTVA